MPQYTPRALDSLTTAIFKNPIAQDGEFLNYKAADIGTVNIQRRIFYDILDSSTSSLAAQTTVIFQNAMNSSSIYTQDVTNNPSGVMFASQNAFLLTGITADVFTKLGASAQLSATDLANVNNNVVTWFNFRTSLYFDSLLGQYPRGEEPTEFRRRDWLVPVSMLWITPLSDRSQTIRVLSTITLTTNAVARIRIGWHGFWVRPVS